MFEERYDLHCHSTFSDGTDTPSELVALAQKHQLKGLSITDHDTLAAYTETPLLTQQAPIAILPGVELSALHGGEPVHVLGYAFSLKSESIHTLCARHKRRREERNLRIVEKLKGLGISLDLSEITEQVKGSWGRPHIANALYKKGVVRSIQEAFDLFLGEGRKAYEKGETVTVEETIDVIHRGGGKAVLAHPHLLKRSTLIRALLKMPFDGLECYYARFAPGQEKKWIDLAKQRNWLITGGSDYHGATKPNSVLGASWVGKETFDRLYNHFLSNS